MALTIAAQQPMHDTHAVVEDGAVDADGHILEPPTLWEEYIDPAFRDRALRFRIDDTFDRMDATRRLFEQDEVRRDLDNDGDAPDGDA